MPTPSPTKRLLCPTCKIPLGSQRTKDGEIYKCTCGGLALSLPIAQRLLTREPLSNIWFGKSRLGAKPCPICALPMKVTHPSPRLSLEVDHCKTCKMIWFDAQELQKTLGTDRLGPSPDPSPKGMDSVYAPDPFLENFPLLIRRRRRFRHPIVFFESLLLALINLIITFFESAAWILGFFRKRP